MKKIVLIFFIFVASVTLFGQAHLATTYVLNHDGSIPALNEITFEATSSNAACTGEILTQDSGGCQVYDFYGYTAINVQTSTFSAWTAGDEITIDVYHSNGTTGQEIITLTYAAQDWGSGIILSEPAPADPGTGSGNATGGAPANVDVTPIDIDGETIDPDVDVLPDGAIDITVDVVVLPDATQPGAPNTDISYGLTITGAIGGQEVTVTLSYSGYTADPQHIYWWNGIGWEVPTTVNWNYTARTVTITFIMPNTRDGSTEIVLGDQNPLPVTLTNFMAQYLDNEFVRVNWTTESESNMYGYKLYRSQSDLAHVEYTSELISATNSPETQVYSFEDYEVAINETYNYWVESIENDGSSSMHGPISITIQEEEIPELPTETVLIGNYPNPFNPVTNIKFDVKEGETAELSIYNAKGQIVVRKDFEATPGGHTFSWDATENSSGIYFYRLSSPSYNSVKKMIMLK